jgi:putative transposase
MCNRYHILIETPRGNVSPGMRRMSGVYTQRFNRRHARVGDADDACRETQ